MSTLGWKVFNSRPTNSPTTSILAFLICAWYKGFPLITSHLYIPVIFLDTSTRVTSCEFDLEICEINKWKVAIRHFVIKIAFSEKMVGDKQGEGISIRTKGPSSRTTHSRHEQGDLIASNLLSTPPPFHAS